jgi:hypothetical protein
LSMDDGTGYVVSLMWRLWPRKWFAVQNFMFLKIDLYSI